MNLESMENLLIRSIVVIDLIVQKLRYLIQNLVT